jgi:hypothetical protein
MGGIMGVGENEMVHEMPDELDGRMLCDGRVILSHPSYH